MNEFAQQTIIDEFQAHVKQKGFPCIAAHDAVTKSTLRYYVAEHMACPKDDREILRFIYEFVDEFRKTEGGYHSVAILFRDPVEITEDIFEKLIWQRLQALSDLDAEQYKYDARVDQSVSSPHFSFSLKEEAFYVIGLHSANQREARRFKYPTLIFNPHAQFERLRESGQYGKMQSIVRQRDKTYSGSVNPMLADFGDSSEVFQYSGRTYPTDWKCPLNPKHESTQYHTSEERDLISSEEGPATTDHRS